MYENYSRQALPPREYRELLGSAICVFNSNNAFVIENILRIDPNASNWYKLIDQTSGRLLSPLKTALAEKSNLQVAEKFEYLIAKRNRIVHSFQITANGQQRLATKDKDHKQFRITTEYLLRFIKENEELSSLLHELRGH